MADEGFGVTLTGSTGYAAELRGINWTGMERTPLKTTHSTTTEGWETYLASDRKEPGSWEVDVLFKGTKNPVTLLTAAVETWTITLPTEAGNSTAFSVACSGFVTGIPTTITYDDITTQSFTIKLTGKPTVTIAT